MTAPPPSAAPATRFLTLPDGRVAYDDSRTPGPLLVLVPGIGDVRAEYRFVRQPLIDAGYRVVTVDLRGMGESDATFATYNGRVIGDDLIALIHHLDAGPATVVGNSIAAGAAVYAAAEAPDLVASLVLVGGFTRGPVMNAAMKAIVRVVMGGPWRVAAWMGMHNTLFPLAKADDHAEHRAAMRDALARPGASAALGQMMLSNHDHAESRYDRVRARSLFVMGTADSDFPDPVAEATEVASALGGQAAFVDGAGHYPHVEAPAAFVELVLPFLSGRQARSA